MHYSAGPTYVKDENQLCLTRVFDKTFYQALSSPEEIKDIMEASSSTLGDQHLPILNSDYFEQHLYQVMPYMKLESIDQIIENDYLWSPLQSLDLCYDILESLEIAYAATGSGHFNHTPHNIFINSHGMVKFMGFSLAPQLLQDPHFISSEFNIFDIYYSSPELVQGLHYPNQSSDLYSLGHCLFHMITGLTPHGSIKDACELINKELNFPDDIRDSLDEEFIEIFKTMIHTDHSHRYQSYRQAISAIQQYYNSIGHVRLKQMEGEKTQLYQSQHFIQHVLPKVEKKPKSLTIKSKSNYNSEIIRRKISTQVQLPKEFKTKITHSHPTKKRRLQQRPHSQMLNRSKTAGKVKKSRNRLTISIVVIALVTIILSLLNTKTHPQKVTEKNSPPLTLVITKQDTEEKAPDQARKEAAATPVHTVDYLWYDKELEKNTPDFNQINLNIIEDLTSVNNDHDIKKIMALQQSSHQQLFAQKNRILNELNEKISTSLKNNKKQEAIKTLKTYSQYLAQNTLSERKDMIELIDQQIPLTENKVENNDLEILALQIINEDIAGAITSVEKIAKNTPANKVNALAPLLIESSNPKLYKTIFTNILSSDDPIITIAHQGQILDAELNSYNLEKKYISVKTYLNKVNINLEIPFDTLNQRMLVTWIKRSDKDETAFLRFMFLMQTGDYTEAYRYLHPYQGPLAQSLKPLLQQVLNSELEFAYQILFKNFHQKFGDGLDLNSMKSNNQIALYHLIEEIQNQYSLADFTVTNKELIRTYLSKLEAHRVTKDSNEIIVGNDSQNRLPHLSHALKNGNTTIRLLPGIYQGPININQSGIKIIACNGVQIHGDININSSLCDLESLKINSGNILIKDNLNSINIKNINLIKGSIKISSHTEKVDVNNCIINGISFADSARKITIKNSLLLPNKELKTNISGSPQRTQFLNCLISAQDTMIFTDHKNVNDMKFRYCLFSSEYYLAKDKNQNYTNLEELQALFPQFNFCIKHEAKFMNQATGDFRLKPQSPGYQKGYKGISIGVQMDKNRVLNLEERIAI
jgi:hypothetical protein